MRSVLAAALCCLAVVPAAAQIGNPAGMEPAVPHAEPGKPAPGQTNNQDRLFVQLFTQGGLAETELGKLADSKASHPSVKSFARRMVQDHAAANSRVAGMARKAGIQLPADTAPEHKATRQRLEPLAARDFDVAYLQAQLVEHQKAVQLLEWEIAQGQEAELQRFAMATLPQVLEHLQIVQALLSELTSTAPQGLATAAASSAPSATR